MALVMLSCDQGVARDVSEGPHAAQIFLHAHRQSCSVKSFRTHEYRHVLCWYSHKLLCYCRAAFVEAFCDQAGFKVSHDEVVKTTMDGITSEIRFMHFQSSV